METKIAKFQKYAAYKDSGVAWLGEVPEHWEVRRVKYLFHEINERSSDGSEDLLSVSQYTGVTKKTDNLDDEILSRASTLEGYKKVHEGDLVSNIMLAWNGSLGFSPYNGITSPAYSVYRLKQGCNRFFHYLLRSEIYKSEFKRNSSGVIESRLRLYTDDFFSIWALLPPIEEQTAIAHFLDEQTAKVDRAIAQKQRLIALLQERRQILIQNAVTGKWSFINGQWQETPQERMKDSGVEWIGEVPVGWEVTEIRRLCETTSGSTPPSGDRKAYYDGSIPWVRTTDLNNDELLDVPEKITNKAIRDTACKVVPRNTVCMGVIQSVASDKVVSCPQKL